MKYFQIDLNELIKIVLLGKETLIPPQLHRTRRLNEYVLYVVTNGSLRLRANDDVIELTPGDIYLFYKDDYQAPVECGFCEYYYVHFNSERIRAVELSDDEYSEQLRSKRELCMRTDTFSPRCYDFLNVLIRQASHINDTELFENITATLQNNILNTSHKEPEKRLELSSAVASIFIKLESSFMNKSYCGDSKPEKNYDTARRIAEYIESHCAEPISGENIEGQFYLTFNHANRVFRKVMGCTIFRYRNIVRIQYAKAKLRASSMAIGDIAADIGFESVHYFSRMFRQIEGLSPSDYRRKFMKIAIDEAEQKEMFCND
ncbi:MAG: AraC family transcriptional regulator [Clostridiales bacterium]|nr:AraC family transcriptional regulator [Clostridiales bacterium]